MAGTVGGWKLGSSSWYDLHCVPADFALDEGITRGYISLWVPFRQPAMRKVDVNGKRGGSPGVEVEDWSFHAHQARKLQLVVPRPRRRTRSAVTVVLDKGAHETGAPSAFATEAVPHS